MGTVVEGYTGLMRAIARSERDVRLGIRGELRELAKPVADQAERLALEEITRIGPRWSKMRVGVTSQIVYVAPKQRGVKSRGLAKRKRPNLATRLRDDAMQPALDFNEASIERGVEQFMNRIADNFSR